MNNEKESCESFYEDLIRLLETIKKNYLESELKLVDGISGDVLNKVWTDEELITPKSELIKCINDKDKVKCEAIVDELINSIKQKDHIIQEEHNNIKKVIDAFNLKRSECDEPYKKVNDCIQNKDGFIKMLIHSCQNQYTKKKDLYDRMRKNIENMICQTNCKFDCKIVKNIILFIISMAAQIGLFSLIGIRGICMGFHVVCFGKYIVVFAMVLLLVCQILLIRRICTLFKKKDITIQYMDILLNKVDMHSIPICDIDRELERVLQIMRE